MTRILPRTMKRLTGQRGVVLPLVAILLIVLLAFAAIAVDLGYMHVVKNELQNAADAAALAGAAVLFNPSNNPPDAPQDAAAIAAATAAAAQNKSGGQPVQGPTNFTVTIDVGHYTFPGAGSSQGSFFPSSNTTQLPGWQTMYFSYLNGANCGGIGKACFINAVRATVSRNNVPRFFSSIWGSSSLSVTGIQAVAYVGFAGALPPNTLSEPVAVCQSSILDSNGNYTCSAGEILASGQTSQWTDFTQPCSTANASTVSGLICPGNNPNGYGNTGTLLLGQGLGTTNGTQGGNVSAFLSCFKSYESTQNPPQPWLLTLPVIDCSSPNCAPLVGAVNVSVVWVTDHGVGHLAAPTQMGGALSTCTSQNSNHVWSCPSSCNGATACCWSSFVSCFNLQFPAGTPAPLQQDTIYVLPSCTPKVLGETGGTNFGILAQYPVLVK